MDWMEGGKTERKRDTRWAGLDGRMVAMSPA